MSIHSITADRLVVLLIINEMKALKLWKGKAPEWITDYKPSLANYDQQDFCEWMQFVFLPNRLVGVQKNTSIILQAKIHFQQDITKGKLLQLLIELDQQL